MKNIIIASLTLSLFALIGYTQIPKDKTQIKQIEKKQVEKKVEPIECYILKSGKVFHEIGGKDFQLQKEITLKNGSKLNSDGTITMKDGKKIKLKENQCVDINGAIINQVKKNK